MLILTAEEVRAALPMDQAIQAMKGAFAALSDGRAEVPLRTRLPVAPHDGLTIVMPGFAQDSNREALAVKLVSLFPHNPDQGLAYIQAAVLVLEPATGRPLAILEGSSLTAIRTGAAGGAGVELLSRTDSRMLALFGAGVQGRTQLEAACTVRDIETAWIFDNDVSAAGKLIEELAGIEPVPEDLRIAASPGEAVAQADVICTATTSHTPVFDDRDLKIGVHISAIGSYTPQMQEIPADTLKRARIVVDDRAAALEETGDLIQPIQAGVFGPDHIAAELGEIVLGRKPGRRSAGEITCFKSVGIAVQDAIAAALAVDNAQEAGLGHDADL